MPRATFFCRLNYIEVRGNLGRGEQFSTNFFITNDPSIIRGLVDHRFSAAMGTLEYQNILDSHLVAYCKIPALAPGSEHQKLFELLLLLNTFEAAFWLHTDSCVGHELAFLVNRGKIHSNIYQGLRTRADSTCATVTLSANDLRELVRFYRRALHPQGMTPVRFHTKANSSRFSRAFSHIGRAQSTAFLSEKITFYCSALEALFSTSQAELAHQIAERVALILASDAEERIKIYRFLKECYSFRSKYIHGSPLTDIAGSRIAEISTLLDSTVRDAVEVILKDKELSSALTSETSLDNYMLGKIFA